MPAGSNVEDIKHCILFARRYLMVSGDEEVKLLLEAFQMSVSACLSHPQTPLLRAQMMGRLMAVKLSPSVKVTPGKPTVHHHLFLALIFILRKRCLICCT